MDIKKFIESATNIWKTSEYPIPGVLMAVYEDEYYATVSTNSNIFTFMSKKDIVYAVVKSKCRIINNPKIGFIYQIISSDIDNQLGKSPMRVISCKQITDDKQIFVKNNILPLL